MSNEQKFSQDLITKIEHRQKLEKEETQVGWYYWLLSKHPFLVLFLSSLVIGTFAAVAFVFTDLPDFSEPSKGFEVRGNYLADKLLTWHKLLNLTGYKSELTNYPYKYFEKINEAAKNKRHIYNSQLTVSKKLRTNIKKTRSRRSSFTNETKTIEFCDNPSEDYAAWTFKTITLRSLWSVEGLKLMCHLEDVLTQGSSYSNVCLRNARIECCPVMSLPNSVAFLAELQSCHNITRESFEVVQSLLSHCAQYYCDNTLMSHCYQERMKSHRVCANIPMQCINSNVVYSIFRFFLEQSRICPFSPNQTFDYVAAFLPASKNRDNLVPLYYANFNSQPSDKIAIHSVDFGINHFVFKDFLLSDSIYPIIAMAIVGLILVLYTGSMFITFMGFLSTASSLLCAYFLYKVLLGFNFFPFMNFASVIVMIGISADSVLIFHSAWKDAVQYYSDVKCDSPPQATLLVKATLKRVAWSLFVTCATTAAAFFASYSSEVTAIKCFGIYTGLAVLAHLFFSLSWLPAVAVIHYKYIGRCLVLHFCKVKSFSFLRIYKKFHQSAHEYFRIFFDQIQVLIIVRLRYFWVLINFLLALGGVVVVLVYPTFRLPSGQTYFHYFQPFHPLETTHIRRFDYQNHSDPKYIVRLVFGIRPRDTGDYRDPSNTGKLQFQRHFNMSSRQSQVWLLKLCQLIKNSSYYSQPAYHSYLLINQTQIDCFIDGFKTWMESESRKCRNKPLCCQPHRFPYEPAVFEECLKEAVFQINRIPGIHLYRDSPGPRFDSNDVIRAVIISFQSNLSYSASFEEIEKFYDDTEHYFQPWLQKAPTGLAGGWFVSDLEFFALQKGLYTGSISSVGWSLLVGLLVILVTTRNFLISIFASVAIASIIFVTVGSLVLLGWELNILESVTVSIAVGLSVDFTAHYAIAYLQATPKSERTRRVEVALSHVCPAIALAALTTFVAGAGMLPATVLIYTKFGVFLMLTMVVSWHFSTYFFLPLLTICGPKDDCCSLRCKCSGEIRESTDRSIVQTETSTCSPPTSSNYEVIERATVL